MEAEKGGLKLLRDSLCRAATWSLLEKHPQYVKAFMQSLDETGDVSKAFYGVEAIPTDVGFAKWRPLLTAEWDTELAIGQIRAALDLLRVVPPRGIPISEGAWLYYHYNAWVFWMDALLERVKKLTTLVVRALVRPTNLRWQEVESDFLKPIRLLSEEVGEIRDPLAHGGGPVEVVMIKERRWEVFMLLLVQLNYGKKYFDELSKIPFLAMTKYRGIWYELLHERSLFALGVIDQEMDKLNKYIDWDKI